jgi:hypothetical protein
MAVDIYILSVTSVIHTAYRGDTEIWFRVAILRMNVLLELQIFLDEANLLCKVHKSTR